jgi:hypothetical protein
MGFKRVIVPRSVGTARANSGEEGVMPCKTLIDVVSAAFVNPAVARSLHSRRNRRKPPARSNEWDRTSVQSSDESPDDGSAELGSIDDV